MPTGAAAIASGGDTFAPSQVNRFGIAWPFAQAVVLIEKPLPMEAEAFVVGVLVVDVLVTVLPLFWRAGATAPGFGSRSARPLDPHAVTRAPIESSATSTTTGRNGRIARTLGASPARRVPGPTGSVPAMADRCLLSVHAHPDDEASKGASTVARYKSEGVRAVLVTCTGGEEGDILNPVMDTPEVRADLHGVRMRELERAAALIGYDEVVLLGYRDSGMPESVANAHPEAFANAPLDEAVARLVRIIRAERPQVILTYGDDQQGYPHPDHLMVHDISIPAFDLAGDPEYRPELGDPFAPSKMYWNLWSRERMIAMHEAFLELGLESPFGEDWFARPAQDDRITTRIDIADWFDVRLEALLAHETQVAPDSAFWFGLPRDVARTVHPWEDFILGRTRVDTTFPESDLFAGIEP